jgi:nucleotide-binding universal stress UspA family protein
VLRLRSRDPTFRWVELFRQRDGLHAKRNRRSMKAEDSPAFSFKTGVVAVDLSPWSDRALACAVALGRKVNADVLDVVVVGASVEDEIRIDTPHGLISMARNAARALVQQHVDHVVERLGQADARSPEIRVTLLDGGSPAATVVEFAATHDVDLIFVGTHGRRGLGRVVLGSVAEQIVRSAGCPVVVVREKAHDREQAKS